MTTSKSNSSTGQIQPTTGGPGAGGGSNGGSGTGGQQKGKLNTFKRKWSWKGAGAGWTVLSVLDWWLLVAGGWLSWQGVFLRWTPVGLCFFASMQWYLHNRELDKKGLPRTATQWQVIEINSFNIFIFSTIFIQSTKLNEKNILLSDERLLLSTLKTDEPMLGMDG